MTLTNRVKTVPRWGGIGIVSLCYFIALAMATFSLSAFIENESMQFSNPVPFNEYHAAINSLLQATDIVFNAAIYGFVICVPLILLIFKKVR
ncbi:hypothetical protein GIX45_13330 [Erwinia sp. CPCC 100877]|nr:hypothetical protein [Erwinia sp. CPCC 100877]